MRGRSMDGAPWPAEALVRLDDLWAEDVHMGRIRYALTPLLGWYPTTEQVVAMANRWEARTHIRCPPPACRPIDGMAKRPPEKPPERPAKGTFKVPAGGFSMLRGRFR